MEKLHFRITCPDCFIQYSVEDIFAESASDPKGVKLIKNDNDESYYYFHHTLCGCKKQAKVSYRAFEEFIKNTKSRKLRFSQKECSQNCLKVNSSNDCMHECLFAVYRKFFLQLLFLKEHIGSKRINDYLDNCDADMLINFDSEAVA